MVSIMMISHGLRRLRPIQVRSGTRGIVTAADVDKARKYCQRQLHDYDAHLIQRTLPPHVRDAYLALRTLNLELVRLPEVVTNPTIGAMRMQFWRESIDKTFAGNPPAEPTCVLLHEAITSLQSRSNGSGSARAAATQMKFWIQRVIRTRERHMDNRPFATLASLEEYAENTYATLMYATLAALPVQSVHADHLASHIGKAAGIVAVLRGVPVARGAASGRRPPPDGSAAQVWARARPRSAAAAGRARRGRRARGGRVPAGARGGGVPGRRLRRGDAGQRPPHHGAGDAQEPPARQGGRARVRARGRGGARLRGRRERRRARHSAELQRAHGGRPAAGVPDEPGEGELQPVCRARELEAAVEHLAGGDEAADIGRIS
ncbi:conserved hypothetical protein [Verticillium alfalfae VaMs.102]|uniref:Squalene/phytoene synthase n=1 Tax=Verticillium alfalfae (strain VaMs.102 / ATCC MYA-4576 / FGSC 10136) TaxID=526221 RepID=C9SS60_VERA1|nr:conserved hypothetical protein [Verticillium alfalfae VaMs.102]EEY21625.1 conserved hypothetical protein [Verticillium alfalfae VaMs.102]